MVELSVVIHNNTRPDRINTELAKKMKIIIPLGGLGRRFQDCGYTRPKPLVRVLGKEIIFWLLDSLKLGEEDEIYIPYNESLERHNFSRIVSLKYPGIKTLALPDTRGASETVKLCVDHFGIEGRLCLLDGDTWYEEDILAEVRQGSENMLVCFDSRTSDPIYSYVVEKDGMVERIREKEKISDLACSGCYVFSDAGLFSRTVASMDLDAPKETYISQVVSNMISEGHDFRTAITERFHVLGTPEQAIAFSKSHAVEPKRFCFDLDNTLVTAPRTPGDYSTVEPIRETIGYLRRLKSMGHNVAIYTARRMRTHGGNVGAVVADIGKVTLDTLERFGIPYDEIHFGKPYAHFYVDDLMADPHSDMNKELGFYMEDVTPRHFNKVEKGETFKKTSTNRSKLDGEAFYHRWVEKCPEDIKKMFPRMLSYENGALETEIVKGTNFSTLYLNQVLKKESIYQLMDCLKKLHDRREDDTTRTSYANFGPKFSERISMYDHERYGLTAESAEELRKRLDYLASEGFKRVMIHGDPVFSNILLDEQGNIKMVDMRGMEGDEPTVFGHELYDFAKVYQSLCGYDEILLDKRITPSYRRSMKEAFEKRFDEKTMENVKTVAASLLLSLIPLHDEPAKYQRYVDLALGLL